MRNVTENVDKLSVTIFAMRRRAEFAQLGRFVVAAA